jgi:hypothetical protein
MPLGISGTKNEEEEEEEDKEIMGSSTRVPTISFFCWQEPFSSKLSKSK